MEYCQTVHLMNSTHLRAESCQATTLLRTINSMRTRKAHHEFFLLPVAPRDCRVPVKLLADFRYQKGYKRRPSTNGLFVFIWWLLPTPPQKKPQNRHSEAPGLEKNHKPLLSWITVVPEKSLLSKILCAYNILCGHPSPSFPFGMSWRE